jgi:hypothetical protein
LAPFIGLGPAITGNWSKEQQLKEPGIFKANRQPSPEMVGDKAAGGWQIEKKELNPPNFRGGDTMANSACGRRSPTGRYLKTELLALQLSQRPLLRRSSSRLRQINLGKSV